jgi:hypothetical protein
MDMEKYMSNELPNTAIGVLDLFATSRTGVDIFSDQIIESVKNGETNPLKVRVWIKTMEEILERVKKETEEAQLTEANKWSEKKFEYAGAIIEKAPVKTDYDYSICNDGEWNSLNAELESIKAKKAQRESFLKALTRVETIIDKETGEVVEIRPPNKKVKDGLKISIR